MVKTIMPIDSGRTILVSDCQQICITELLQQFREQYKKIFVKSKLNALGVELEIATSSPQYGGERLWFKCPICKSRVEKIYKHPHRHLLGCRSCLGLEYASRRFKGMIEAT